MSKPNKRRVAPRVAGFAITTGGICLLLSLPAEQANAATVGQPSLLFGLTSTVSGVIQVVTDPVTGTLGSVVNSVTEPPASTAPTVTQAPVAGDQATGRAKARSSAQPPHAP